MFYVGFMASSLPFVFVCAVFHVGFKRFFLVNSLFCCVSVVFYVGFIRCLLVLFD